MSHHRNDEGSTDVVGFPAARHPRGTAPSAPAARSSVVKARSALHVRVHHEGGRIEGHELSPWRVYTFGRSASADLLVECDRVSRIHGTIFFHDGWVVSDANSSNGTWVVNALEHERALHVDGEAQATRIDGTRYTLAAGEAILLGTRRAWIEVLAPGAFQANSAVPETDDQQLSTAARTFHREIEAASRHRRNVLLLGPTGAGKTHAAEKIHALSGAKGRLVAVNCAGLPTDPTQLRSVLFGHSKGAFTGAVDALTGYVYAADGGTLFLDEVESLNEVAQGFLLDVLERSGAPLPLGCAPGDKLKAPEVRVLAASKARLVASALRRDLQFRLGGGDIVVVPSLVQRREDIPGLARAFLAAEAEDVKRTARFTADALATLQFAAWPGEVRQLRAVVGACFRAAADAERAPVVVIDAARVSSRLAREEEMHGSATAASWDANPTQLNLRVRGSVVEGEPLPRSSVNPRTLDADQVRAALAAERGNIEHAARRLGIGRRTLMSKMDKLGVPRAGRRR